MNRYFDWKNMSPMRRRYSLRLVGRCIVLILSLAFAIVRPGDFELIRGWNFFRSFSLLHLLWAVWVFDMLVQILPVGKNIPLGSQKLFRMRFVAAREKINRELLKNYIRQTSSSAGGVMLLWIALTAAIGLLKLKGVLGDVQIFLISALFYVCDLICVLIWCPFRLMLKTRCCTTCRIFNWDHLMMFSPMLFVKGFYSWSLLGLAILAVIIWEINVLLHPERFWDHSNAALLCSNCTDKLCSQYCRKLR